MRAHLPALCPTFLAALALGGCGGSGEGLDSNGRPIGSAGGAATPLTADFQSIQDHVFTPICSVCHSGAGAPQGLRLDAANSYSLLVGVPSTEVPSVQRVAPGNPDGSYLIQKLEGRASVGARMPLGGPYLDATTIAVIRQWITAGAKRSTAASVMRSMTVVVATPGPGDMVSEAPAHVVVEFSGDLEPGPVGMAALRLERIDPSSVGPSASVVDAEAAVPVANARALVVTPRASLVPGRYRLVLGEESDKSPDGAVGIALNATGPTGSTRILTEFDVEGRP